MRLCIYPHGNDVDAMILPVADGRGVMTEESEGDFADVRGLGLLGHERDAVLNVLLREYRQELHLHHTRRGSGDDDQARGLVFLVVVAELQHTGQSLLAGVAHALYRSLAPSYSFADSAKEVLNTGEGCDVQLGLEAPAAVTGQLGNARHQDGGEDADDNAVPEGHAPCRAEGVGEDVLRLQPDPDRQGNPHDKGLLLAEAILQDGPNTFDEEHAHDDHQDGAGDGSGDCEEGGDNLREQGQPDQHGPGGITHASGGDAREPYQGYRRRQVDDSGQRTRNSRQEYSHAARVQRALDTAEVYGPRSLKGCLLDHGALVAGLDSNHHAHDKEYEQKGQEILVEDGAEPGPGRELGEAEPGGVEGALEVVDAKGHGDDTAHDDGYGNGHEPPDAGAAQHEDRCGGEGSRPHGGARQRRGICGHVFESGEGNGHRGDGNDHEGYAGDDGRNDPAELGQPEGEGELDEGGGDYQAGHDGQAAFRNGQDADRQEGGPGAHEHDVARAQAPELDGLVSSRQPTDQEGSEDSP